VPKGSRCEGIPYCEHGCRLERAEKMELLRGEGVSAGSVYVVPQFGTRLSSGPRHVSVLDQDVSQF